MPGEVFALAIMAMVTYLTRIGGLIMVELIPPSEAMKTLLDHLAQSVLAGLLASILIRSDWAVALGTGAAALIMLWSRRPLLGMTLGVLVTASVRFAAGLL